MAKRAGCCVVCSGRYLVDYFTFFPRPNHRDHQLDQRVTSHVYPRTSQTSLRPNAINTSM